MQFLTIAATQRPLPEARFISQKKTEVLKQEHRKLNVATSVLFLAAENGVQF
jgi:hypothetical protein